MRMHVFIYMFITCRYVCHTYVCIWILQWYSRYCVYWDEHARPAHVCQENSSGRLSWVLILGSISIILSLSISLLSYSNTNTYTRLLTLTHPLMFHHTQSMCFFIMISYIKILLAYFYIFSNVFPLVHDEVGQPGWRHTLARCAQPWIGHCGSQVDRPLSARFFWVELIMNKEQLCPAQSWRTVSCCRYRVFQSTTIPFFALLFY